MYKNLRWKFLIIAIVAGLSIWSFVPPSTKVRLGLDLKGGIHLVLQVHTDDGRDLRREIASAVVARGWGLLELRQLRMSLEDVFLHLTTEEPAATAATEEAAAPAATEVADE